MTKYVEIARLTRRTKIYSRFIQALSPEVRRSEMSEQEEVSSLSEMELGQPQVGNRVGTTFRAAYARKVFGLPYISSSPPSFITINIIINSDSLSSSSSNPKVAALFGILHIVSGLALLVANTFAIL